MSAIFSRGAKPTQLNRVQINQSVNGYPLPVVLGRNKVQQSLLWVDGMTAKKVSGGKGLGGGKDGQFLYSADVIAALCNGPISAVGDVWCGQSWLSGGNTQEIYTIAGPLPTYTPVNASSGVFIDGSVGMQQTYSDTQTDLGSGGAVTLSGTDLAPMEKVPFGTTLTTGQYSINPTGNIYNFAAADAGQTVVLSYSFALNIIKQQETDLIPAGKTVQVGGTFEFHQDFGVVYFTGPNNGVAFKKVSGTPSVAGTYSVSGSAPATYHFAAADVGEEIQITYQIQNDSAVPTGAPGTLNFSVFEGTKGQAIWSLLTSTFPQAALGYTGIAFAAYDPMTLGFAAEVQQNVFEVITPDGYGGTIQDCNPISCILQVLTNSVWGLGAGAVPFPTSAIDAPSTWGGPNAPGAHVGNTTAWNWFAANSFFISPVIDHLDTAASVISKWLEAGQCAAFMSEGLLKLVPYGDTSTAGNGVTWKAPSDFAAQLDDTSFSEKAKGQDPVKISSSPWQDAYNTVQVQWSNRANQYAPEITPESDQAAINRYGSRIEDPQDWDFITTLPAAAFAASMRVKRNVYTRNTYEFSLPFAYSYLECMDVVYITTSSQWAAGLNNANLAVSSLPVRITKLVDNPDGTIEITAEDYPFGVHQPTIYNKGLNSGNNPNLFEAPGDTVAVIFEATSRLTNFAGGEIWIGAMGTSDKWGSCNVLVSQDNTTYKSIGTIESPARLGVLDQTFASGSDPDTTNSLVVDLAENSLPLDAGSSADADSANTLCYVDGELLSYSAAAVTGQNQTTMDTYIRRGQFGSAIGSHASGSKFLRLDDSIFKFLYDPSFAGQTIYFKFQSVNVFGNGAQDPSTITPVTFLVPGQGTGAPPAQTVDIINPSFEIGTDLPPYGWTLIPGGTIVGMGYDTSAPYSGARSFTLTKTSTSGPVQFINKQQFSVRAGDSYQLSAALKLSTGGTGDEVQAKFSFVDQNGTAISGGGDDIVCSQTAGTWAIITASGVVPAGAVFGIVVLELQSSHFATGEWDSLKLLRVPNLSTDVTGTLPITSVGARTGAITFVIDGGGSVVTTGVKGQVSIPNDCTITGWVITADQSGSAVVDVLKSSYSGFPTTASIAGSDFPTLSSAQKNDDTTLSGWGSTAISAGDIVQFSVSSCTTCQRLIVTLNVEITG